MFDLKTDTTTTEPQKITGKVVITDIRISFFRAIELAIKWSVAFALAGGIVTAFFWWLVMLLLRSGK